MSQHDYGLAIKKSDTFYIVDVNPDVYNSGYGVVSKEEDPYGKYDLADVQAWAAENPDKVLTEHPLEAQMKLERQLAEEQAELAEINRQLFDEMVDKVFADETAGISTMSLDTGDSVATLLAKRAEAKQAIASIQSQLEALQSA